MCGGVGAGFKQGGDHDECCELQQFGVSENKLNSNTTEAENVGKGWIET